MRAHGVAAGALLAASVGCAWAAEDDVTLKESRDYLVGAAINSSVDAFGTSRRENRLAGIWAFQLGRFRFATSGASALLYQGRESVESGVSTELARSDLVSLSTSLSLDEGRSWSKDPVFNGLPRVRDTVRGRLTAGFTLSERWSASVRASQDLLGREGGLRVDSGLNYRYPVSSQTHWDLSLGAGWANRTFSQTQYGISAESAARTGLPSYAAGSGWDGLSVGWRITSAISRRWVVYGGVSIARLQGDASRSPLATRRTTPAATVGLAYRNI